MHLETVEKNRNSWVGRLYFSYFTRTGMRRPSLETTCFVRDIILRQIWHWMITGRVLDTRIPPIAVIMVVSLVVLSLLFTEFMRVLVATIALGIPFATVILVAVYVFYTAFEKGMDRLLDWVKYGSGSWLEYLHTRFWSMSIPGTEIPLPYLVLPLVIGVVQVFMFTSNSNILLFIAYMMLMFEFAAMGLFGVTLLFVFGEKVSLHFGSRGSSSSSLSTRNVRTTVPSRQRQTFRIKLSILWIQIKNRVCLPVEWVD